jgi:hypothetical protein
MRAGFQRNSTPRHLPKGLYHRFRAGGDLLLNNHLARPVENTIEARPIPKIETNGLLLILQFFHPMYCLCTTLLHCRSPYLVRLECVDNLGVKCILPETSLLIPSILAS